MSQSNLLNLQMEGTPGSWIVEDMLFDILTAYLPIVSPVTALEAAQEIDKLFPSHRAEIAGEERESPGSFLAEFWDLFFRVTSQISYATDGMDRAVQLIQALHGLPSETIQLQGDRSAELWSDLPYMSMAWSERFNQTTELKKQRNLIGLRALMMNEDIGGGHARALRSLQNSFECELDSPDDPVVMQGHLPIALVWLEVSTLKLWQCCKEEALQQEDSAITIWEGKKGFSTARFQFWLDRLIQKEMRQGLDEVYAEQVERVLRNMTKIMGDKAAGAI
ncbi:hypothetical protein BT63DRAFT_481054 [Microthyrium microscopicum]|uniref:Uncharacterized protein n=1 Tax=Microthyrium microscopicum TaxID=703497 RepID=A0A6A6U3R3_9PEZI|nr:hypothetical protein BT63DRAFT_481054 [Microthyrium microscopicum]